MNIVGLLHVRCPVGAIVAQPVAGATGCAQRLPSEGPVDLLPEM
ncbi:hypothetical protein ACWCRD_42605 [Streptomyces sp. NPDC002092]